MFGNKKYNKNGFNTRQNNQHQNPNNLTKDDLHQYSSYIEYRMGMVDKNIEIMIRQIDHVGDNITMLMNNIIDINKTSEKNIIELKDLIKKSYRTRIREVPPSFKIEPGNKPKNNIMDFLSSINIEPISSMGIFSPTDLKNFSKGNELKNENSENSEDNDNCSEYDSDDEFEELTGKINTLDDLITFANMIPSDSIEAKEDKKAEVKSSKNNTLSDKFLDDFLLNKKDNIPDATTRDMTSNIMSEIINIINGTMSTSSKNNKNTCNVTELNKTDNIIPEMLNVTNNTDAMDELNEIYRKNEMYRKDEMKKKADNKKSYSVVNGKKYGINLYTLSKLKIPLIKLRSLVGLNKIKDQIVDMILYHIQHFEKRNNNMMHTVIEGPPGVGKTELGKILAEIYAGLGIIKSNKIKFAKRSDLIGEFLGHTAKKTQKVIDDADGGVLVIDEAYSLGNDDKRDSYSKECIDTLNLNLSENKRKFVCIIMGYKSELDKCFFSVNPGLERRFPFRYKIEGYNHNELCDIFIKKIKETNFKVDEDKLSKDELMIFFKEHILDFPNYGGDIENLIVQCKFMHSRRVAGMHPKNRRKLTNVDIINGLKKFKSYQKENENYCRFIYS